MAAYTFFYNPMSRAQIARWALHEVAADYESVFVAWDNKPAALMDANPMGKIPTIIHHTTAGDHVVSEAAAVCHYLAATSSTGLVPDASEMADYFRWMFFAAGPLETAITNKAMGWEPKDARQEMTVGFGSFDRTVETLDWWLSQHEYVCGSRFTMADVYLGSQVDWGLQFGTLPELASFKTYQARIQSRAPYQAAKAIDMELIAQAQAADAN